MKLQKQLSRRTKDKEYIKWVLVIPPRIVQDAGLKEGDELDIAVKNKKIILSQKR